MTSHWLLILHYYRYERPFVAIALAIRAGARKRKPGRARHE